MLTRLGKRLIRCWSSHREIIRSQYELLIRYTLDIYATVTTMLTFCDVIITLGTRYIIHYMDFLSNEMEDL